MPVTVLGAVDTKISKTQSPPSSCLHSSVRNMLATDECNEVMKTDIRETQEIRKDVSGNNILST